MLVCRALEPYAAHFFTTRAWHLGFTSAGGRDAGWAEVARAAGVADAVLVHVHQVHGIRAIDVEAATPTTEADIIVGRDAERALAVQAADCVPLLIADPVTRAVAAVHAGWRGLAAGAPGAAIDAMARAFGSRARDLVAAIGPSIGACCYEVGADVRHAFAATGAGEPELARWFGEAPRPTALNPSMPGLPGARRADHWYFDGWAAARDQLEAAGVPAGQVHTAGLCTASHIETFCSYRREGKAAGRLAGVIRPLRP